MWNSCPSKDIRRADLGGAATKSHSLWPITHKDVYLSMTRKTVTDAYAHALSETPTTLIGHLQDFRNMCPKYRSPTNSYWSQALTCCSNFWEMWIPNLPTSIFHNCIAHRTTLCITDMGTNTLYTCFYDTLQAAEPILPYFTELPNHFLVMTYWGLWNNRLPRFRKSWANKSRPKVCFIEFEMGLTREYEWGYNPSLNQGYFIRSWGHLTH